MKHSQRDNERRRIRAAKLALGKPAVSKYARKNGRGMDPALGAPYGSGEPITGDMYQKLANHFKGDA